MILILQKMQKFNDTSLLIGHVSTIFKSRGTHSVNRSATTRTT